MIEIIAAILGVIVVVVQAIWQRRQQTRRLENDPAQDVRETELAATAGDETSVQSTFEAWDLRGRMRDPRRADGVRLYRPKAEGDRGPR